MLCPKCGAENPEGGSTCVQCGGPLPAEGGGGGSQHSDAGGDAVALRRGIPLWVLLAVLAGLALVFVAGPRFLRWEHPARPPHRVCLSNVKNISLAFQMYVADNDEVFPPAAEWCDTITEYVKNHDVYRCPSAGQGGYAYAYNAALSVAMYEVIADPVHVVVIFESDEGWNAAGGPELLPADPRHLGGDNYGFADGHAKWVGRENMMSGEAGVRWEP